MYDRVDYEFSGALRRAEIYKISVDDVTTTLIVKVPDTKTHQ